MSHLVLFAVVLQSEENTLAVFSWVHFDSYDRQIIVLERDTNMFQ